MIPAAGIHLTARFATGIDERAALDAARDADIDLHGISAFYADSPAESGILFGYGGIDAPAIDVALTRLAGVLKRCA